MIKPLQYLKDSRIICRTLTAIEQRVKKNHVWLTFFNGMAIIFLFGFAIFSYVSRERTSAEIIQSQEQMIQKQDSTKMAIGATIDTLIYKIKNKSGRERKDRSSKRSR